MVRAFVELSGWLSVGPLAVIGLAVLAVALFPASLGHD
jgi:hypothetical protein